MIRIPLLNLNRQYSFMKDGIDGALKRCLDHQHWILGPETAEFEAAAAAYLGARYAVAVSSGTDALVMALRALAITVKGKEYFDPSDEFLTTAFTFTATGDAILRAGGTPVFVDIDPATFNIDIDQVRGYLSSARSASQPVNQSTSQPLTPSVSRSAGVVGILPVHLFGQSCHMTDLGDLVRRYGLLMVEDGAQAFGAEWEGKKVGTFGHAGAFSFFPSKNLGCFGDGGMVVTDDGSLADTVRMLARHGGKDKYNVDHIGYNARLDTIQAAVLLEKLKYLDDFNARRRAIAATYDRELTAIGGLVLPFSHQDHVHHQYTVRVEGGRRDRLRAFLAERGVESAVYYPVCLHAMRAFQGRAKTAGPLTGAERASAEVLSLPVDPLQTTEDTDHVIRSVRQFFR